MVNTEIWLLPFWSSSRIECYHFGIWLVAVMVVAVLVVAVLGVTVLFCYRSDCYSLKCHAIYEILRGWTTDIARLQVQVKELMHKTSDYSNQFTSV